MGAFKIDTFGGMAPAVDERLLPNHSAAHSENTWLYSGRLSGMPAFELVKALTPGTAKVFRIPNNYVDAAHIDDSDWIEFQNADTDVIRAVVLDDTFDRYYWASSTDTPKYNTHARITASSAPFELGIPQPGASTLAIAGGTGLPETRAYVTTWVSAYGEEGPASTPVLGTGNNDATWTLTIPGAAAGDLGTDRNLTHTNIYRTITGSDGTTTFFFVAQITIATLTYADSALDATVSANSELESTNWTAPPADLQGFITMPNGIVAGWRQNEIWFCEPYRPHAWPAAYTLVVDYPIVGLGVVGQTLVVCTQAYPITITGVSPATMAQAKSPTLEPCQSRGSIISAADGVYYASPNGLVFAGNGVITNISQNLITKDKWQTFVDVPSLRAARVGTAYYAFGSARAGSFDPASFDTSSFAQDDFTGAYAGVLLDAAQNSTQYSLTKFEGTVGFNLLSETDPVTSIQNDTWSGELFMVQSNNLYRLNLAVANPSRRVYKWRSKIFQMTLKENLAAMRIYWELPPDPPATGPPPATPALGAEFPELPVGSQYGVVRIYADDVLVYTRNLLKSGELIRPPSGFKADYWQVEVETYLTIFSIQIGSSVKALASV